MKAIIGIGVPGCGKTTVLKPLAERGGLAYVNADDIREELTGDPTNHSKESVVWQVAYERIAAGLSGHGVVIDATHSRRRDRLKMITFCREHGAREIIGYWFDVPLATCLIRNAQRIRKVPEAVIRTMCQRLTTAPPRLDEGYDEIVRTTTDINNID